MFEYLFMPFGLSNAAQSFQRLMDRLFGRLPFVFTYLDDILVFSKNEEDHRRHLQETFTRLRSARLTANAEKCEFGKTNIEFLGHTVSANGIAPLQAGPGRVPVRYASGRAKTSDPSQCGFRARPAGHEDDLIVS